MPLMPYSPLFLSPCKRSSAAANANQFTHTLPQPRQPVQPHYVRLAEVAFAYRAYVAHPRDHRHIDRCATKQLHRRNARGCHPPAKPTQTINCRATSKAPLPFPTHPFRSTPSITPLAR